VSRGAHAQCEEPVIRHVVRELAEERRAELLSGAQRFIYTYVCVCARVCTI
jgi:hypothetical protein